MTAEAHDPRPRPQARTPAAVRDALSGADRAGFERDYQQALRRAAADYDLTAMHDVIDQWWQVAVLTADQPAHQRMLDVVADLKAGRPVNSTPWSVVRADLGI